MLDKLKSPRFWAGIAGAITIILLAFGIRIPGDAVNEILGVVSGALVLFGIAPLPPFNGGDGATESESETDTENKTE